MTAVRRRARSCQSIGFETSPSKPACTRSGPESRCPSAVQASTGTSDVSGSSAQRLQDLEPVAAGQEDVEQDDVRRVGDRTRDRLAGGARALDDEA